MIERIYESQVESADDADVVLSTVHRAKGLEFRQVWLADDFEPLMDENDELRWSAEPSFAEEVNLHYVAVTRAMNAIRLSPDVESALLAIGAGKRPAMPAANDEANTSRPRHAPALALLTRKRSSPHDAGRAKVAPPQVGPYLFASPMMMLDNFGRERELISAQEAVGRALLRMGVATVHEIVSASGFSEGRVLDAAVALVRARLVPVGSFRESAERIAKLAAAEGLSVEANEGQLLPSAELPIQTNEAALGRKALTGGPGLRQIADSIREGDAEVAATLAAMNDKGIISRYAIAAVDKYLRQAT